MVKLGTSRSCKASKMLNLGDDGTDKKHNVSNFISVYITVADLGFYKGGFYYIT